MQLRHSSMMDALKSLKLEKENLPGTQHRKRPTASTGISQTVLYIAVEALIQAETL